MRFARAQVNCFVKAGEAGHEKYFQVVDPSKGVVIDLSKKALGSASGMVLSTLLHGARPSDCL